MSNNRYSATLDITNHEKDIEWWIQKKGYTFTIDIKDITHVMLSNDWVEVETRLSSDKTKLHLTTIKDEND